MVKIKLSELCDALEGQNDDSYNVFNKKTGEIHMIWDGMVDGEDDEELIEELEESEDYIDMPTKYDIHEYEIMRSFVYHLREGKFQDQLFRAISGRGAFRRFREVLEDFGQEDNWYKFRDARYEQIGREWAEHCGVEIEEDIPSMLHFLEDEEWNMDYDAASNYWIVKDKEAKKMKRPELMKVMEQFIKTHNTCALATGSDDFVRCTPIEYNYLKGAFYLFSEGGLKFRALRDNKNVCMAIYESYSGFGTLKGMQVSGIAEIIEPFSEEYDRLLTYKKIPKEAMQKLPQPMNLIKVVPTVIDYLDSDLKKNGYGSRQQIRL
jgi:general stress protein 26